MILAEDRAVFKYHSGPSENKIYRSFDVAILIILPALFGMNIEAYPDCR